MMVMLVIVSFAFTSINLISAQGSAITREQAIEISRNTPIVQEAIGSSRGLMVIEAYYWSAIYIGTLKEKHPNMTEWRNLPEDHGAWRVHWDITPPGYQITHYIDELTGQILFEGVYYAG